MKLAADAAVLKEEPMAIDFPITPLMDEQASYDYLLNVLHPGGLICPGCGSADDFGVHRRHRAPVLDYQCRRCRRVFNAFTLTALHKTCRRPSELVLILRGFAQGETTARLARELGRDRSRLLKLRHELQANAVAAADRSPLPQVVVEADEMYQNAGEKRGKACRPERSAALPGQQGQRARHLGQRSSAGVGHHRAGRW